MSSAEKRPISSSCAKAMFLTPSSPSLRRVRAVILAPASSTTSPVLAFFQSEVDLALRIQPASSGVVQLPSLLCLKEILPKK